MNNDRTDEVEAGDPTGETGERQPAPTAVDLSLNNEEVVQLTRADVLAAASTMLRDQRHHDSGTAPVDPLPSPDDERVQLQLDPNAGSGDLAAVDVLAVVALALNVEPDEIRPRPAVEALRKLRFTIIGAGVVANASRTRRNRRDTTDEPADALPAPTESVGRLVPGDSPEQQGHDDLTPDLAFRLQRLAGQWVAVRDGKLLTAAPSLRELRTALGEQRASVMFVPLPNKNRSR